MKHRLLTRLVPLILALSVAAQTPVPKLVQIPLLDCAGLPCVDLSTGSGKTLRLLIDTGEANSYLDIKAAQALGVELQPLKDSNGDAISQVQQTIVTGAKLGDLAMGDFPFMVLDTTPQSDKPGQKMERLPGDGALTYNAFKNRLLQIDYANHVIRISEPQTDAQPCPRACSDLIVKRFGSFGPVTLTADGFTLNGQPVDAQIDTLFTGTMFVYPGAVEKLGLKKESKSKHKEVFPYTQSGLKLARADGETEGFRDLTLLQNAPLYFGTADDHLPVVAFDATVGMGLLSHARVTFDFKGMHIWMEAH
ncbi:MAG: retropepsin-like aspartic protease [Bryobacteraceae bacterium]